MQFCDESRIPPAVAESEPPTDPEPALAPSQAEPEQAAAIEAPRPPRLRLVFKAQRADADDAPRQEQQPAPLQPSAVKRPRATPPAKAFKAPLKSDPRLRVLLADRGNTLLPAALGRKRARKASGALHAVAGSNVTTDAASSLSYGLSAGRIVQCACCQAARGESLRAQAPQVLRVHSLLTSAGAALESGGGPARERLHAVLLAAYGGSSTAPPEERSRALLRHLADELLNRRGVAAIRSEAAPGGGVVVALLVCAQRATEAMEQAAAREARRLAAAAASRRASRTSDRARARRVWTDAGSLPECSDDEGSDSGDDDEAASEGAAESAPQAGRRGVHEAPEGKGASSPASSTPVTVVLVDVSELTPVPERLRAPPVGRRAAAAEAQAASDASVDDGAAATAEAPAQLPADESAPAPSASSAEAVASLGGRGKRAVRPSALLSDPGSIGASSAHLLAAAAGPIVLPPGSAFTSDDAMRLMLRLGYTAPISVEDQPDRGRCVYSAGYIPRGSFVTEYAGQLIPHAEAREREARYRFIDRGASGCYMYFFSFAGRGHCVDATAERPQYGVGRLVSHSRRSPTCHTQRFTVDGTPRLALVAARDIMYGEELSYDYGDTSAKAARAFEWLKKA